MSDRSEALRARLGELPVEVVDAADDEPKLVVEGDSLAALLGRLREEAGGGFDLLFDLTAIDRGAGATPRFEVVYRLRASESGEAVRVHGGVDESETIESAAALWPAAGWLEREVQDLFGLVFRGHPDPRRLLLEADFEGAPLRKDFARQPGRPVPKAAVG